MAPNVEEASQRTRLVERYLHTDESVDGMFETQQGCVVAVTSERILIVSGGSTKGWSLMGIPWHLVRGVDVSEVSDPPVGGGTLHIRYSGRARRFQRNTDSADTDEAIDLLPEAEDAEQIVTLIEARRLQITQAAAHAAP